ncbi:MAG: hypothetical protein DSZ32_05440 [Gammaproteobacteria bacterium]|nr:MAG: hypothetical protein DSZ32_05440 [Gammaproteobacteria bacterium]
MKTLISALLLLSTTGWTANSYALDADQAIKNCLSNWGKHPFNKHHPKYRVLKNRSKVSILNQGGGDIKDTRTTSRPDLVLVKPGVSVLNKTRLTLTNPNGWYCLHNNVNVLTKLYVTLGCKSHIASSKDGVNVLVKNDKGDEENMGSVNVLTKTYVERKCK